MELVFGARQLDRVVTDADQFLLTYRGDDGYPYLDYQATSPNDHVVPEDLAVTLLVNSRVTGRAFKSMQKLGASVNLGQLPDMPLEATSQAERKAVAATIAEVANWPGIQTSVATKILHKKKPALIPILDNRAIFGAYLNRSWPGQKPLEDSIRDQYRIEQALDWIAFDLARGENAAVWPQLRTIEPRRSFVELFDCVWWMYFLKTELERRPRRK